MKSKYQVIFKIKPQTKRDLHAVCGTNFAIRFWCQIVSMSNHVMVHFTNNRTAGLAKQKWTQGVY